MRRAADVLVDSLKIHGVDRVLCVPGESYLGVIDALYDTPDIDVVTVRQEGGGGFMAVADAKYTGRPGVEFVSRGPGATNAAIGVHVAQQDAVPLILFVGQVARIDLGREAFQELNYTKTFGDMAKLVLEVLDPDDLADAVAEQDRRYRQDHWVRCRSQIDSDFGDGRDVHVLPDRPKGRQQTQDNGQKDDFGFGALCHF